MNLGRRQVIERVRREIARQQGRGQHLLLGEELHRRRRVAAAQHHHQLHVVLEHQLLGADQRLVGQILVVIGDDLDHVVVVADLDPAGGVNMVGPDEAAIATGQAPGGDLAGQRGEEAQLHHLLGAPRDIGGAERRRGNGARRRCSGARELPACKSLLAHDLVSPLGAAARSAIARRNSAEAARSITLPKRNRRSKAYSLSLIRVKTVR